MRNPRSINAPLPHRKDYVRDAKIFFWCIGTVAALALALTIFLLILMIIRCSRDFSALGELLLVLVIAIGESVGFLALQSASKDREFEIWDKLQKVWTDRTFVQNRGLAFARLEATRKGQKVKFYGKEKEIALDVCRKLDEFAHLANFFGRDEVIGVWGNPLGKSWLALEDSIDEERRADAHWAKKWDAFYQLGKSSLQILDARGENPDPRQVADSSMSEAILGATSFGLWFIKGCGF